jgi:hypothetical protein
MHYKIRGDDLLGRRLVFVRDGRRKNLPYFLIPR